MHEKELRILFCSKENILGKRNEKSSIDGNDDLVSFLTYNHVITISDNRARFWCFNRLDEHSANCREIQCTGLLTCI